MKLVSFSFKVNIHQDRIHCMRTFHDQILKPAVVEANATGMHLQKVKLEEDLRIKQEKEKLELERLKKEKEGKGRNLSKMPYCSM